MFCLSRATRIFTVVTWPEPKFECGLFSSAAPICRSMLQQSQELFKIRTQMPKTLFQTPRCRTVSLCLQNWFLLRRGGDLQHWSLDNLSLRCSFRVQKKRGLCKESFRSTSKRSPGKGLFFHWPHVKAEQPTKPLQVRERKEGVWMSFLLLRTSLVVWKVSKKALHYQSTAHPMDQHIRQITAHQHSPPVAPSAPGSFCHRVTVLLHSPWHCQGPHCSEPFPEQHVDHLEWQFCLGHPKS